MAWGRNKSRPLDLTGRWAGRVLGVRGSLFRDARATGLAPLTHGLSSSCQLLSAASLFQLDALQRHVIGIFPIRDIVFFLLYVRVGFYQM